jgi:hypothetical protein
MKFGKLGLSLLLPSIMSFRTLTEEASMGEIETIRSGVHRESSLVGGAFCFFVPTMENAQPRFDFYWLLVCLFFLLAFFFALISFVLTSPDTLSAKRARCSPLPQLMEKQRTISIPLC